MTGRVYVPAKIWDEASPDERAKIARCGENGVLGIPAVDGNHYVFDGAAVDESSFPAPFVRLSIEGKPDTAKPIPTRGIPTIAEAVVAVDAVRIAGGKPPLTLEDASILNDLGVDALAADITDKLAGTTKSLS